MAVTNESTQAEDRKPIYGALNKRDKLPRGRGCMTLVVRIKDMLATG